MSVFFYCSTFCTEGSEGIQSVTTNQGLNHNVANQLVNFPLNELTFCKPLVNAQVCVYQVLIWRTSGIHYVYVLSLTY